MGAGAAARDGVALARKPVARPAVLAPRRPAPAWRLVAGPDVEPPVRQPRARGPRVRVPPDAAQGLLEWPAAVEPQPREPQGPRALQRPEAAAWQGAGALRPAPRRPEAQRVLPSGGASRSRRRPSLCVRAKSSGAPCQARSMAASVSASLSPGSGWKRSACRPGSSCRSFRLGSCRSRRLVFIKVNGVAR
jgi:hypothetical protein